MDQAEIIEKTRDYVRKTLEGQDSAHDWWHTERVWKNAQHICTEELKVSHKADKLVIELAALLHDLTDWKDNSGNSNIGAESARNILKELGVDNEKLLSHVYKIIQNLSFKGVSDNKSRIETLEGQIVQDADRLDAIGAIGIGRVFAYGGAKNFR